MITYAQKNNTFVFAVTGTIGSGKSAFAKMLAKKIDAIYINADEIGHKALLELQNEITNIFGSGILNESGAIDRKKLGSIVFKNKKYLEKLESIVHPYINKYIENIIQNESKSAVVLEAAVLNKMNTDKICDVIIYVESMKEKIVKRLMKRGLSKEKALDIIKRQRDIKIMKRKADITVKNTKDLNHLCKIADNIGRLYDREKSFCLRKRRSIFK